MNKRSLLNAALNMENSPLPKMEREIMLGRELHKITKLKGLTNHCNPQYDESLISS